MVNTQVKYKYFEFIYQMSLRVFEESGNTLKTVVGLVKRPSGILKDCQK